MIKTTGINVKKQIDMYLENIDSPADVKKLSFNELNDLSNEIRASLLQKLSEHGGHFGPNFGMVEATIALPSAWLADWRKDAT